MIKPIHLSEGLRMMKRFLRVRKEGFKEYSGNARKISKQIVNDCWNGDYLQTSTGHFCEFWIRDFGWSVDSLIELGYQDKVVKTLDYALEKYSKSNRIRTTINPKGRSFDFPGKIAPDSLAYMLYALSKVKDEKILNKYKSFIEEQVNCYLGKILDKDSGMIKKHKHFSSMKDYSIRNSSCYDNVMLAVISKNLDELKIKNPLKKYNYKKLLMNNFWNGSFFEDDLDKKGYVSSDANIMPFFFDVVNDKKIKKSCFKAMEDASLDSPFPVRYVNSEKKVHKTLFFEFIADGYERNSIWMHIGPLYIKVLSSIDKKKAREHLEKYTKLIEKHKTFLELFDSDGKPFKRLGYVTDEGMIWAANYLTLCKNLK